MHHGPLGLFTWNHLWYLVYLWHYTLIYALLSPGLKWLGQRRQRWQTRPVLCFFILASSITLIELTLEPVFPRTHALVDDWYNHARYFLIFVTGYFVAKSPTLYYAIINHRWPLTIAILPLYLGTLVIKQTEWLTINSQLERSITVFFLVTNTLCWLFATVALCGTYLTKPSKTLSYLNEEILPWYILHQTVIIVIAMVLAPIALGGALESMLLCLGTVLTCAVLYEAIKRWNFTRFVFGMKPSHKNYVST